MSGDDLTSDALKQEYATVIPRADTFKPQGVSDQAAFDYLNTNEGAMYYWRVAEAAEPGLRPDQIRNRAIGQITSGRELPRMETLNAHEPLTKIVPAGTPPSTFSPFWAKEAELDAAVNSGKNLSQHFGLPIVSEAARYDIYRITPKVPTQVFVNTVAPTSELYGLVNKSGGAEQSLVPNRQLFDAPVHVRSVDNRLNLTAEVERGGLSPNFVRGASALGVAAVAYDATTTATHSADLLRQGNTTGAQSQVEHFGALNLGALGGAALGAEVFGAAGAETGPLDLVIGAGGAIAGAVAGDKLANAYDNHRIYNQSDAQGQTWSYDPKQPQHGWTREVPPLPETPHGQRLTAAPALADRLTFQANNTAVELALAHPAAPRDPYTQPANANDTPSHRDAPWTHDAQTQQWSRRVTDQVMEHGLTSAHTEIATAQRAAQLDTAAQRTMAENLAGSKQGIAEHYQAAYQQRGWAQHGPMPEAVNHALKEPSAHLQVSTTKAPATAEPPRLNDPRNPEHPQHATYEKLRDQVAGAYGKHGLSLSHDQLERTTARVMYDAQAKNLDIKEIHLNRDPKAQQVGPNSFLVAFSGDAKEVTSRRSFTHVSQAQQVPAEHTFQQLGQLQQQQAQTAMQQAQAPQINGAGMGGTGIGGGR